MRFDNYSMDLGRDSKDCILVCNKSIIESSKAIKNVTKQFFSDNETDPNKWTGGKINHDFIDQVKKDGEGENPRIDLNQYYGLGEQWTEKEDLFKDVLIGYGTTTLRKTSYGGIPLSKIIINTNLVSSYGILGMDDLYHDFIKYVETYISAIRNENATGEGKDKGLKVSGHSSSHILWQWRFGNEGEWDIIQTGIANNPEWNGIISFDWIMEHVLYEKRIKGKDSKYNLPENNGVLDTARSFIKSKNGLKYQLVKTEKDGTFLDTKGYSEVSAIISLKFGPFTVYLTDNDVWSAWSLNSDYGGIWPIWNAPN